MAISYFSRLSPYVPATPQQVASTWVAVSPGTRPIRSMAGVPMPWPRCWQGAWYGTSRSTSWKSVRSSPRSCISIRYSQMS